MENRKLPHIDERLGHVAIDMGLLTRQQVDDVKYRVIMSNASTGSSATFEEVARENGILTAKELDAIKAEERRRRRLITGYEIINLIGVGNVASVYHALQLAMDREVALKILHPSLASDPDFVKAYIAEAQAVSRFHHPHIVQGFDAGESNGFFYFSHEYLSGGSMADKLRAGQSFSETRLLSYLRQTTSGLKHAWNAAVYHGDINPGNLLLDGEGNIKLANLGVPRVAGLRGAKADRRTPGFVRCGPNYAAPEQLERPDTVNAQTDIYSLGATFYHISFGVPPFPGVDAEEILAGRSANPMPSFSLKAQESFSGKYLRLLHDMLDPDPEKRPANPEKLAERLEIFHRPDAEDTGQLSRQMRQVSSSTAIAAASQRLRSRAHKPNADATDRVFSLRLRRDSIRSGRGGAWLVAAAVLVATAMIVYFVFSR